MKYAVIQTGGKQYRVSEGDTIEVERLTAKPTESMVFTDVLLAVTDGEVAVGTPFVSGLKVTADVVANIRGEKIRIRKFKAKARYRRTTGHRQELTQLKITQIGDKKEKKAESVEKAEKVTVVTEKSVVKTPRVTKKNA
ncbi:MAG: 50S ribosomal protein L21 [Candidatus Levybacteria bacterium]|nr:50S ribosomal protein L21 [Candidatus Levybacteria bacterium]